MRPINDKLRMDLLEAGKKEFLLLGYRDASLRRIAASLGVTTGAIYRYYSDKGTLFNVLVEEPARGLAERYQHMPQPFVLLALDQAEKASHEIGSLLNYVYANFDAFKLIFCCASGTKYENYLDTLAELGGYSSRKSIEQMTKMGYELNPVDDDQLFMISGALSYGLFEMVRHDVPKEKAKENMLHLQNFYSAGWGKVLGLLQK